MKKQFIAKLLVLVMLLSMVPATVLTASAAGDNVGSGSSGGGDNEIYRNKEHNEIYGAVKDTKVAELPSSSGIVIDKATTSADMIEVTDGEVVVNATVVDGTAKVKLTLGAVKKLANAVEDGVITLTIDDEGASKLVVSLPAKALTALAKATGADLTIQSSVATISVSNALMAEVGTAGTVQIKAEAATSGVTATIVVNGKELKDVEGFEAE